MMIYEKLGNGTHVSGLVNNVFLTNFGMRGAGEGFVCFVVFKNMWFWVSLLLFQKFSIFTHPSASYEATLLEMLVHAFNKFRCEGGGGRWMKQMTKSQLMICTLFSSYDVYYSRTLSESECTGPIVATPEAQSFNITIFPPTPISDANLNNLCAVCGPFCCSPSVGYHL